MALSGKGNFKIDGVEFKPKSLKLKFDSLASEDSGRTDDGTMQISWVLSRVRKLEITMPPMTYDKVAQLLSKVQGRMYNITYFDVIANAEKTIYCYTSNSEAECYSGALYNGLYEGVSFSAIEVGGET